MRRADRELPRDKAETLLEKYGYGVLSLVAPGNEPYSVPLSFVYSGGCIYLHCANEGQKLDCIKYNPKARFTVAGEAETTQDGYSMRYESAAADGTAKIVENPEEKRAALLELCKKYYPETLADAQALEQANNYIDKYFARTTVIKIELSGVTGKANK